MADLGRNRRPAMCTEGTKGAVAFSPKGTTHSRHRCYLSPFSSCISPNRVADPPAATVAPRTGPADVDPSCAPCRHVPDDGSAWEHHSQSKEGQEEQHREPHVPRHHQWGQEDAQQQQAAASEANHSLAEQRIAIKLQPGVPRHQNIGEGNAVARPHCERISHGANIAFARDGAARLELGRGDPAMLSPQPTEQRPVCLAAHPGYRSCPRTAWRSPFGVRAEHTWQRGSTLPSSRCGAENGLGLQPGPNQLPRQLTTTRRRVG